MPKTPQKKKIFHMESRLSIIFILNYEKKCVSKVENGLISHLILLGIQDQKTFQNPGAGMDMRTGCLGLSCLTRTISN